MVVRELIFTTKNLTLSESPVWWQNYINSFDTSDPWITQKWTKNLKEEWGAVSHTAKDSRRGFKHVLEFSDAKLTTLFLLKWG